MSFSHMSQLSIYYSRPLLKSLQRDYDVKRLIIDCEHDIALKLLKQAQEIGMIRYDYEYILTTLVSFAGNL